MKTESEIIADNVDIDWRRVLSRTAAEPVVVDEWHMTLYPKPPLGERVRLMDAAPAGTVEAGAATIVAVSCDAAGRYLFELTDVEIFTSLPAADVVIDSANRLIESLNDAYGFTTEHVAEAVRYDGYLGMLLELSREMNMTTRELLERADSVELMLQAGWNSHVNRLHEETSERNR